MGVLGRILPDHEVRVHDLAGDLEIDGVVGMDVLGRGRLVLDTPEQLLEFRWR
jgi:hypothetical protein